MEWIIQKISYLVILISISILIKANKHISSGVQRKISNRPSSMADLNTISTLAPQRNRLDVESTLRLIFWYIHDMTLRLSNVAHDVFNASCVLDCTSAIYMNQVTMYKLSKNNFSLILHPQICHLHFTWKWYRTFFTLSKQYCLHIF